MMRIPLQMIAVVALLVLDSRAAHAGYSRCMNGDELKDREDAFLRHYWNSTGRNEKLPAATTCAQAARNPRKELWFRALAPWTYRVNRDDNRRPLDIIESVCLCEGCILDQKENMSYNSVPVYIWQKVLNVTRCCNDTSKYTVKKVWIKIAVACTCVVPKF